MTIETGTSLLVAMVAGLVMIFDKISFSALRGVVNYLSIAIISLFSYNYLLKKEFPEKAIKTFILLWLFVGAVQMLINKEFLSFLLAEARTTANRGVYALANEPSFYGITMVFFLFLAKDFSTQKIIYMAICFVQIVLLSQSAFAILCAGIFLMMYIIGEVHPLSKQLQFFGLILVGLIIFYFALLAFWPQSRIIHLIKSFFRGTLFDDVSVNLRLQAIIDSIDIAVNNFFLPNGYNERIMSGYGAVLVELGVFGIPLILIVTKCVCSVFRNKKCLILNGICFTLIMLGAIQLAHPMIAFIMGYGMKKKRVKNNV